MPQEMEIDNRKRASDEEVRHLRSKVKLVQKHHFDSQPVVNHLQDKDQSHSETEYETMDFSENDSFLQNPANIVTENSERKFEGVNVVLNANEENVPTFPPIQQHSELRITFTKINRGFYEKKIAVYCFLPSWTAIICTFFSKFSIRNDINTSFMNNSDTTKGVNNFSECFWIRMNY